MSFDKQRYKYVVLPNKVIAISTYAGKTVKGIAKCDPRDKFDISKGKELAAARCNLKVAERRLARAEKESEKAYEELRRADAHSTAMDMYLVDSEHAVLKARNELNDALKHINS